MEGACIYRDTNDIVNLVMYKEISKNNIFYLQYWDNTLGYSYLTNKELTRILPISSIHILTSLPFFTDIRLMIKIWKDLVYNQLQKLNTKNKKLPNLINTYSTPR